MCSILSWKCILKILFLIFNTLESYFTIYSITIQMSFSLAVRYFLQTQLWLLHLKYNLYLRQFIIFTKWKPYCNIIIVIFSLSVFKSYSLKTSEVLCHFYQTKILIDKNFCIIDVFCMIFLSLMCFYSCVYAYIY